MGFSRVRTLLPALVILLALTLPGMGQENADTPWLDGVDIPPVPSIPTPEMPVEISMPNGGPLPATMSEDLPVIFEAKSPLFTAPVPTSWQNQNLTNAEWVGNCSSNWYFNDLGKNQSTLASVDASLPRDQMAIIPLNPCRDAAVTVFLNRAMRYEEKPGVLRRIYVNGGKAFKTRVLDITPPLCGMEIAVTTKKATIWTVENPPNHHPLPKLGDVNAQGDLLAEAGISSSGPVARIELGSTAVISPDSLLVPLPERGVVKLHPLVTDNDQVDESSIQFGLCELQGGIPRIIGQANAPEIDLSAHPLPKSVYLFITAKDLSGNSGSLFIPVKGK